MSIENLKEEILKRLGVIFKSEPFKSVTDSGIESYGFVYSNLISDAMAVRGNGRDRFVVTLTMGEANSTLSLRDKVFFGVCIHHDILKYTFCNEIFSMFTEYSLNDSLNNACFSIAIRDDDSVIMVDGKRLKDPIKIGKSVKTPNAPSSVAVH